MSSTSIGLPIPATEIVIRDDDGNDQPIGEVGEICIRGPQVMAGYWNRPDETAKVMTPDGFFKSGDMGFMDEDGFVHIVDRAKDMIITGGENVFSVEVEGAIYEHPGVQECAVIGVPHDRWGEEIKAMVVLREGMTAKPQELLAVARGKIAPFKIPKTVDFVDALPRTPSGKVQKAKLRAPFWEGRERQVN